MYRKIKDYFRLFLYNTFLFLFLITPKILMKYILKFFAFFAFKFNKKHIKVARANLDFVYGDSISEDRKMRLFITLINLWFLICMSLLKIKI